MSCSGHQSEKGSCDIYIVTDSDSVNDEVESNDFTTDFFFLKTTEF